MNLAEASRTLAELEALAAQVEAVETRLTHFEEVNQGLPDAFESHRCFSCGHCTQCDTCLVYCPEGIVRREAPSYAVDYTYCKGCGICFTECPRHAITMVDEASFTKEEK